MSVKTSWADDVAKGQHVYAYSASQAETSGAVEEVHLKRMEDESTH